MPLNDEQKQALSVLAAADPKDVAEALHADANAHYQHIFRVGYGKAKGEYTNPEGTGKLDVAEAARAAAEAERDEAKQRADALGSKDADFAAERERLTKAAQDAKRAADEAKAAAEERIKGIYRAAQEKALLAKLAPTIDPLYAENAVVPAARERIRIDGVADDGTPQVSYLDADGVPLSGGLDALAAQLAANVDPRFKTSHVDAGGGAQPGGGGGPAGGSSLADAMKARYANRPNKPAESDAPRAARFAPAS